MSPAKLKPKADTASKNVQLPVEDLTYEQALAELEQIVSSLEASVPGQAGRLSLEEAMALFERGQALCSRCVDLLDKAELRVKQLSGETLVDLPSDI